MAEDFGTKYINANRAANARAYESNQFMRWESRLREALSFYTPGLSTAVLVWPIVIGDGIQANHA
jgi:hypothetical protein